MASMIKVATEKTIPPLAAQSIVTQINPGFFQRHCMASLNPIRTCSADGDEGMRGWFGKNTDGIAHTVDIMDTTISIDGTLSGVGQRKGIKTGAIAIPTDNAKQ